MKQPKPIVVSGSIAIDRIMNFSGRYRDQIHPEKLDELSISLFLDSLKDAYGGVGANIAYTLALLGDEPILLGSVGPEGLIYMEHLARQGVNIKHIHESKLPTASFTVMTDADQNQIGGFYPGAMFDSEWLTFEPWQGSEAIVVVAPHDPAAMKRQVQEAKQWNLKLLYDIGQQVSNLPAEDMKEGVKAADILIVNEYEMTVLAQKTGLGIDQIKSSVPIVITTLGSKGSIIEGKEVGSPTQVSVVPPNSVEDPTGAGDAFRSGLLYGLSRDWPLKACAQLGAVCATYAIETQGTQSHVFDLKEAAERYNKTFGEKLPEG